MLNSVQLIGFLGKDPEVKTFDNNKRKAVFTMATTERRKNARGETTESTEWHTVVFWDSMAEVANKFFRKGQQVYVQGKLQTRSWDAKDGSKRYVTEVVAAQVLLLGKREESATKQRLDFSGLERPHPSGYNQADLDGGSQQAQFTF